VRFFLSSMSTLLKCQPISGWVTENKKASR
jgi:hypothetical protein